MYKFRYHKAQSLDEAKKLLTESNEGKILAGGQTLIPTMKQRLASPEILIDIGNIKEIQNIDKKNDSIIIGAGSKHSSVAASDVVISYIPALAELAENIGDPHVRHMGTIGGSISNNDPTADYPAACLGLGATIKTVDREISADNFFTGFFDTCLNEDEIVIEVDFPIPERSCYMKFPNPASRYAMAGVFIAVFNSSVKVAVTGASENGVFRWTKMEDVLSSNFTVSEAENIKLSPEGVMSDIHGDSDYRANLVNVMAKRAVEKLNG